MHSITDTHDQEPDNSPSEMPLPREAIAEFAELYKRRYGIELGAEEAATRARNLLALYSAVLRADAADMRELRPRTENAP